MPTSSRSSRTALTLSCLLAAPFVSAQTEVGAGAYEYRLLATNKTSTMEKELNQAGGEGFRYGHVMGVRRASADPKSSWS